MPTAATQGPSVATPALPTAAVAPLPHASSPGLLTLGAHAQRGLL